MFFTCHTALSKRRRRVSGFTLTETAVILGVALSLLAAVWAAASRVYTSNKIRTTIQQLEATVNNIRGIFAEQGSVTNNATNSLMQALDQLKAFPI